MRENENGRWYDDSAVNPGDALCSRFEQVLSLSRTRLELDRFYCSLYYDRSYQGFGSALTAAEAFLEGMREKLNENIVFRVVQVQCARFAKQKPKPAVLTDGADWAKQQRAKQYDKFIWATMHDAKIFELQRQSDLKLLLTGTGAIYAGSADGKLYCEEVPSWELFADPAESRYGTPKTLYRRSFVDRGELIDSYPKHEREIMAAASASVDDVFAATGRDNADMVPVITGWRLPSGNRKGKVMVAIQGTELDSGEYNRKRFPFAFCRYALAPEGLFGIGVVSQLVGLQVEHNRTLVARQHALRKLGAAHYAVERGSKIVKAAISNRMEDIIEYTGSPPHVLIPSVINPETFQHGDRVKSSMFQLGGVSEMAASSMKPAGLNSGKAIRTYADTLDDAIHDVMLRREQQILDLAEIILDELEELSDSDEEIQARYVDSYGVETIRFSEVKMDRDSFVLKVQPTSSLSTSLSGKLEDVAELSEQGLIAPDDTVTKLELLQLPDLEAALSKQNAMPRLLMKVLEEEILGKGNFVVPEPDWDLQMCLKLCMQVKLQAQLRRAPEDRIELLRSWEKQVAGYLLKSQPQTPALPQDGMVPPEPAMPSPETPVGGEMPIA